LIEWDNAIPTLDTLLDEASKAEAVAHRALEGMARALAG
jgi:hypothetical protein